MSDVRNAAQNFEGSLMILRKDKNGWVFGFSVHPSEAPNALLDAPLGTRFQCVLFQVGDNEEFVPIQESLDGKRAVAKAGELCRKDSFYSYLCDLDAKFTGADTGVTAAEMLRNYLDIDSRSELKTNVHAQDKFNELVSAYMEHTGEWNA
jgi:hypothetical protein